MRKSRVKQMKQPTLCLQHLISLKAMINAQDICYKPILGTKPPCTNNPEQAALKLLVKTCSTYSDIKFARQEINDPYLRQIQSNIAVIILIQS